MISSPQARPRPLWQRALPLLLVPQSLLLQAWLALLVPLVPLVPQSLLLQAWLALPELHLKPPPPLALAQPLFEPKPQSRKRPAEQQSEYFST